MKAHLTIFTSVAIVALQPGSGVAQREVYEPPMYRGHRVDLCRMSGQGCGEPAANYFCELMHYGRAIYFEVELDIGATTPTMTLEDQTVCAQAQCDGFRSITCSDPVPGKSPVEPQPQPPAQPQPATFVGPPWTAKDVIDARLDVQAQYALFRMFKGDPLQRIEASYILTAVKEGLLKGIYQEDQQVPALRAQELGKWWGQILPKGADGVCMTEPVDKPYIIAMRRGTPADKTRYDASLLEAWAQCSIHMNIPPRAYDPSAPGDPPATGTPMKCAGAEQKVALVARCEHGRSDYAARCDRWRDFVHPFEKVTPEKYARCLELANIRFDVCVSEAERMCR